MKYDGSNEACCGETVLRVGVGVGLKPVRSRL